MGKKDVLKARAEELGVSTLGTVSDLQSRIARAEAKLEKKPEVVEEEVVEEIVPVVEVEEGPKVQEMKVESIEEVPAEVIEVKEKVEEPKIPEAVPTSVTEALVTVTALVTTVKFAGKAYLLEKGKPFTGPAHVVDIFRKHGFVE